MKKRTWYLTLLTIITVICIAIGLLVHVVLPAGNWLSDMSDDLDAVSYTHLTLPTKLEV